MTRALHEQALYLDDLGDHATALSLYTAVVERSSGATDRELRRRSARSATRKAGLLARAGSVSECLSVLETAIRELELADDLDEPDVWARALLARAELLFYGERLAEAVVVGDAVISRLENSTDPEVRKLVARALMAKSGRLGALGRTTEAAAAFEQLANEFSQDALATIDDAERTLDGSDDPVDRLNLASYLMMKAGILSELDREDEAESVLTSLIARFGNDDDPGIAAIIANVRDLLEDDDDDTD